MSQFTDKEMERFTELRDEIDRVDDEIIRLLKRRFELVHNIGDLKNSKGIEVYDKSREKEVIERCKERSKGIDKEFIEKFIQLVMDESKRIQKEKK